MVNDVTIRYTHNVKNFAAPTSPGNYLHSTEHTKWLIWYNETTARVVCANVLYFPNSPRTLTHYSTLFTRTIKIYRIRKSQEFLHFLLYSCYSTLKLHFPILILCSITVNLSQLKLIYCPNIVPVRFPNTMK
jgi:hypothetical protein